MIPSFDIALPAVLFSVDIEMPFSNVSDGRFVFQDFATCRRATDRRECPWRKPVVEVLGIHGAMWVSMRITRCASEKDITLYGRRKDTKEGIVNVLPDKAKILGVRVLA